MSRTIGLSGIKSLGMFKSSSGFNSGMANAKLPSASSMVSSETLTGGSFANLKLTAEKLVKEQASAKTDLELANSKLKKLTEQVRILEEKLQQAFNENAKLKAKQKEDERLWNGLETKFSSTKTMSDQLTETLQHLTVQVQDAEKDKAFFEDKLSSTSVALDKLHEHMKSLSLRLESSEETLRTREKELMELGITKERMETSFMDEQKRVANLMEEKDNIIKQLEAAVATDKNALESLTSEIEDLKLEMTGRENDLLELGNSKEILERENMDLLCSRLDYSNRLETALKEIKNLEDFVQVLVSKFTELENQNLSFSEKVIQLNLMFDTCLKLVREEKELIAHRSQKQFDMIHNQCISVTSERNSLQLVNEELKDKILELQKEQEFAMVQHAEECRLAEEKIRKLESEVETLISKRTEMQALIAKLEDDIESSLENSRISDKTTQDLLLKLSEAEKQSKALTEELKADALKKQGEIDLLQKEIEKSEEYAESIQKRANELQNALGEKDQLVLELKTREKQIEDEKAQIMESLAEKESKLEEAKKQYDQMLDSKQLELSKHLKEISLRNDKAINDIRKKYEAEKQECVNLEKEKAEKVIQDIEKQREQKIAEYKEESQQHLIRAQEEHTAMIIRIRQEHDQKEMSIKSKYSEELKRTQLQAESELREKSVSLRSEHEAQLRALRCEHEDECRRLQEELDIQKAKEERQRAILQLQLKVMGDNPQVDQEVNSRKMRNSDSGKRNQRPRDMPEDEETDSPCLKATETPVSTLLKKVEKAKTGIVMSLPKHSRKVTHREYEIETSNGTITKRRKTKSTVMFADPGKQGKRNTPKARTPKARTPKAVNQGIKGGVHPNPSNIGDLFSEGSLNPYADDPYAFD